MSSAKERLISVTVLIVFLFLSSVSAADHLVLVPKPKGKTAPILVTLPGFGVKAEDDQANWKFTASNHGMVLVSMNVDYSKMVDEPSVDALYRRILAAVQDAGAGNLKVDRKNLLLGGTSAGGMMAIALVLRHPETFRATAVICGSDLRFGAENFLKNAKGEPFYLAHGDHDAVVPFAQFESTKARLTENGAVVEPIVYQGSGHVLSGAYGKAGKWLASNLPDRPDVNADGPSDGK